MKKSLTLSMCWFLCTVGILQLPITILAPSKEDKQREFKGLIRQYKEAKALYKKRQKQGASQAELDKIKQTMKVVRNKAIAIGGIAAFIAAITAAVVYLSHVAKERDAELIQEQQEKEKLLIKLALADPTQGTVMADFWKEVEKGIESIKAKLEKRPFKAWKGEGEEAWRREEEERMSVLGSGVAASLFYTCQMYKEKHGEKFRVWLERSEPTFVDRIIELNKEHPELKMYKEMQESIDRHHHPQCKTGDLQKIKPNP